MVSEKMGGGVAGGSAGERMVETWLPLRCRLRSEVRAVRGARSEREVNSLNSRLSEIKVEVGGEDGGIGVRDEIWLLLAQRVVRSWNFEATEQMEVQFRRVSSRVSSLIPLNERSAPSRSSSRMFSKRLPLWRVSRGRSSIAPSLT